MKTMIISIILISFSLIAQFPTPATPSDLAPASPKTTLDMKTISFEAISLSIPKSWNRSGNKNLWINGKGDSVNFIAENIPGYNLKSYVDLSIKNMKKMIKSYKLIKRSTKKVNGETLGILLGEFNMYNTDIRLYSVVMDINGVKYVLSVGGPKVSFDKLDKTFNKIINSMKKK